MEKKIEYCVDTSYFDKNNQTYISYENNEYFVDLESAKEYYNSLNVENNELKTLWQFEIDESGNFENFEIVLESKGV